MNSLTGIPVELLFTALGALVSGVYFDMKKSLNALTKQGNRRDMKMSQLMIYVRQLCEKANISFIVDANDDEK